MDVNLSTSVILVIAVALWLFWVAPYLMRVKRARELAAAADSTAALPAAPLFRVQPTPSTGAQQATGTQQPQEAVMNTSTEGPTNNASPASAKVAPLKIRYGRTVIAGVGALALVAALVTAVLKLVGLIHAVVPIVLLLIFVAAVVGLRVLAIRDRRAKVSAAFRVAMGTSTAARSTSSQSRPTSESTTTAASRSAGASPARVAGGAAASKPVFDDQMSASRASTLASQSAVDTPPSLTSPSSAARPLTATELRSAALEVAANGSSATSVPTWQPVQVPKPAYVEAPKAERPAPAPLQLPDAPKPAAKTSIKASEAAIAAPAAGSVAGPVATATKPRPTHGLSNLDDVLQRRRA